jgi:GT2 family glycosyltransferase
LVAKTNVGAVIVTFNRRELLLRCLQANADQSRRLDFILVVDNASTDGTEEAILGSDMSGDPRLQYFRLGSNLGGAGGFHFGMQKAMDLGCDWIWLMDDDAIPAVDALEKLLEQVPPDDLPPVMAGRVIDSRGATYIRPRANLGKWSLRIKPVRKDAYILDAFSANVVSFVGPLIPCSHVKKCGLPRADFFIYYDDFEYTHRLFRGGFGIRCVPGSVIQHLDDGRSKKRVSAGANTSWRMYYTNRNRVFWLRNVAEVRLVLYFRLVQIFMREMLEILIRQPHKIERISLLFKAYSDGWQGRLGKTLDPTV